MAVALEKILEITMKKYHMKLEAGQEGIWNMVDWVHNVEDIQVVDFLKGRELIVIMGIKQPDETELLAFTQRVYEAGVSGLIFNLGPYIEKIPEQVLLFGEEHHFPIFSLPWEVHLVEFNREICNLIYKADQENQSLESAFRKAIFEPEEKESYQSILRHEGILIEEDFCMIQCYLPTHSAENMKENTYDIAQFQYHFLRHLEKIGNRINRKHAILRHDLYVTFILCHMELSEIQNIVKQIYECPFMSEENNRIYVAVSSLKTKLEAFPKCFKALSLLCKKNAKDGQYVCYADQIGVWKILLAVEDKQALLDYKEDMLGEIERLDRETGSDYCHILEEYIQQNGNVQEVAAACFIHRNTVTNHLKKIAEILNCNLNDSHVRYELFLAFQIRELLLFQV